MKSGLKSNIYVSLKKDASKLTFKSNLDYIVQMKKLFKPYIPIAEAFERLMHPFAEVVMHDLVQDKIVAIYNPLSKREVGDSSYLDRIDFSDQGDDNIIGPYEKMNYDGRQFKSISIVLRHEQKAFGFLCINLDVSVFEKFQGVLSMFLAKNENLPPESENLFKDDLYERINIFVQTYCRDNHVSLDALTREHKLDLIIKLKDEGALKGKNATNYIARTLNISRATFYNYLKEIET